MACWRKRRIWLQGGFGDDPIDGLVPREEVAALLDLAPVGAREIPEEVPAAFARLEDSASREEVADETRNELVRRLDVIVAEVIAVRLGLHVWQQGAMTSRRRETRERFQRTVPSPVYARGEFVQRRTIGCRRSLRKDGQDVGRRSAGRQDAVASLGARGGAAPNLLASGALSLVWQPCPY